MTGNAIPKRPKEAPLKTRISASLRREIAARYAVLQEQTGLGDSDLVTQGLVRLLNDYKEQGQFVIRNLND